jgi:hypothetical protein
MKAREVRKNELSMLKRKALLEAGDFVGLQITKMLHLFVYTIVVN